MTIVVDPLRKPKVSDLPNPILEEDISGLQIAMDNAMLGQVLQPLRDFIDNLAPVQIMVLLGVLLEVSSFAELGDEVAVVVRELYVDELEDVGVVQLFDDV